MKERVGLFLKKAAPVVLEHIRVAVPMLITFALVAATAHAGPFGNSIGAAGADAQNGIQTAGAGMLGWQGMRVWMDEHHSINPGRIAGALGGALFAYAPQSIANWASGW